MGVSAAAMAYVGAVHRDQNADVKVMNSVPVRVDFGVAQRGTTKPLESRISPMWRM
jgi:hypothetical protein